MPSTVTTRHESWCRFRAPFTVGRPHRRHQLGVLLLIPLGGLASCPHHGTPRARPRPRRTRRRRRLAIFSSWRFLTLAASTPAGGSSANHPRRRHLLALPSAPRARSLHHPRPPSHPTCPGRAPSGTSSSSFCMNHGRPLMNGIGAAPTTDSPRAGLRASPRLLRRLTAAVSSGAVMARIRLGATVRGCIGVCRNRLYLPSSWFRPVGASPPPCALIYRLPAHSSPPSDTVSATVAPARTVAPSP